MAEMPFFVANYLILPYNISNRNGGPISIIFVLKKCQGCHDFSNVIVASRRKIGQGNALTSISIIINEEST